MKPLFLTTAAFAALVMVAPVAQPARASDDENRCVAQFDAIWYGSLTAKQHEYNVAECHAPPVAAPAPAPARVKMYNDLARAVPQWAQINTSPAFVQWLDQIDPAMRRSRRAFLNEAHDANNAEGVISVFTKFMSSAPAPAVGRYLVDTCTAAGSTDTPWRLAFDTVESRLEFWQDGHVAAGRWGPYVTDTIAPIQSNLVTATIGSEAHKLTVTLANATGQLTWVEKARSGTMSCRFDSSSDVRPLVLASDFAKPAPAVASIARVLPLTFDRDRATAAILVGSTPVTMLVDTGANEMSVTETVANTLIANHEAVEDRPSHITFADGSTKEERTIKIDTVTVAGRELHGVYAGVTPNTASMLLSLDVLNQIGGKFSIDRAKSEMVFE